MNKKNSNRVKLTIILLALMMLIGGVIGGTLAWLVATTEPVVNTFAVGNITLTLTETPNAKSATDKTDNDIWQGKLVPGTTIFKDPKVTVVGGSEACWIFVEITEECSVQKEENINYSFDEFVDYEVVTTGDNGWKKVPNTEGVYYCQVDASSSNQEFPVLVDNQVSISADVTKAMMDKVTADNAPKLTFQAYAIQREGLKNADLTDANSAEKAWALIKSNAENN